MNFVLKFQLVVALLPDSCVDLLSVTIAVSFFLSCSSDDSEPIYGNMGFQWQDKNIGERWQNYQKTHTVLRGVNSVTNK